MADPAATSAELLERVTSSGRQLSQAGDRRCCRCCRAVAHGRARPGPSPAPRASASIIATAPADVSQRCEDPFPLLPETHRSEGTCRGRAERRHTGYVFVWSSEGWLGIEKPLEGRLSTALSPRGRASAASDEQGRDDDHYQQRKTPQEQPRGAIRPPLAVPQPDAVMPQLSSRHRPVRELRLPPKFQPLADLCNQSTGHGATLRPMPRFANRGFAALP